MTVKLTNDHLEQISSYLAEKYPVLKGTRSKQSSRDIEIDIRERIVRVEEELKNQRDLIREILTSIDRRFEQVDKRFEQVDKRFEQVDKRFEQVDKRFEQVDKRFEQIDKRFEQVDKRFEEMRIDMNTRFEEQRADINTRFEMMQSSMDKRFEMIQTSIDKRFEQVDKKFSLMMWFMGAGFTVTTTIITLFISHLR